MTPIGARRGHVLRLRALSLPPARPARSRTARRSGATRNMQMGWVGVTTTIVIILAIVGTIELLQAPNSRAGAGAGGGQGGTPISNPKGQSAAGAGDRPAVAVHVPLSPVRRRRDVLAGVAGRAHGRVPRHLARRDPLVLGLPARRQGRRRARRRQHRLHDARSTWGSSRSAAPSCAACGTATCTPTATSSPRPGSAAGSRSARHRTPRRLHYLPKYARVYYPDPTARGG